MARPTPTTGPSAWACSLWTPRRTGTRSLWLTTQALQVGLQAVPPCPLGGQRRSCQVKCFRPLGSGSRPLLSLQVPPGPRPRSGVLPDSAYEQSEPRARKGGHLGFGHCWASQVWWLRVSPLGRGKKARKGRVGEGEKLPRCRDSRGDPKVALGVHVSCMDTLAVCASAYMQGALCTRVRTRTSRGVHHAHAAVLAHLCCPSTHLCVRA